MAWRDHLLFVLGYGVGCSTTALVTHIKPWKMLSDQRVLLLLKDIAKSESQASVEAQLLAAEVWETFMSKQLSNLEENGYYIICLVAHAAAIGFLFFKWTWLLLKDSRPVSKHDLNQLSERLEGLGLVPKLQNTINPPPRDPSSTSRSDPSAERLQGLGLVLGLQNTINPPPRVFSSTSRVILQLPVQPPVQPPVLIAIEMRQMNTLLPKVDQMPVNE